MPYTLYTMAVILQTICCQMDNCELDLMFSKCVELDCFTLVVHMVTFMIFFPGILDSRTKWQWAGIGTKWRQQDWNCEEVIKTSGASDVTLRRYCKVIHYMCYEFVLIMAWCPLDNKPLTKPMMTKIRHDIWCPLATIKTNALKCIGQKVVECVNDNWKYVAYCNKNASKLFDFLYFYY